MHRKRIWNDGSAEVFGKIPRSLAVILYYHACISTIVASEKGHKSLSFNARKSIDISRMLVQVVSHPEPSRSGIARAIVTNRLPHLK